MGVEVKAADEAREEGEGKEEVAEDKSVFCDVEKETAENERRASREAEMSVKA